MRVSCARRDIGSCDATRSQLHGGVRAHTGVYLAAGREEWRRGGGIVGVDAVRSATVRERSLTGTDVWQERVPPFLAKRLRLSLSLFLSPSLSRNFPCDFYIPCLRESTACSIRRDSIVESSVYARRRRRGRGSSVRAIDSIQRSRFSFSLFSRRVPRGCIGLFFAGQAKDKAAWIARTTT